MPLKNHWQKIFGSVLLRGSAVLMAANFLANLGNYVFNLLVGRRLGPVDYGIMSVVIALLYIVSVPSTALNLIVTKFTSRFKAQGEFDRLAYFFSQLNKLLLFSCSLVLLFFTLASRPLAHFLKIDSGLPVIFLGGLLGASLLSALGNSTLQGLLKFNFLAVSGIVAVAVKLAVGVGLVWLGFSVSGALTGFLAGFLTPYLIAFWPLKFLFREKKEASRVNWREVSRFAAPALFSTLGLTLLYNSDVILVKHFFSAEEAGWYAALSLIARIILFVTAPIGMVMFPLVAEKHTRNERYTGLLGTSLLLTVFIAAAATIGYALFPELVVKIFFGREYLAAAPYLGRFAVFLSLFSLCNLWGSFYLAVQKVRIATLPFFFGVLQLGLLWFHHGSLAEVLRVATLTTLALLLGFVVYWTGVEMMNRRGEEVTN